MSGVLASLVPVFAVILLGRLLKRGRLVADAFWQPAEAVTFYIFFPALLVSNTDTGDYHPSEVNPDRALRAEGPRPKVPPP